MATFCDVDRNIQPTKPTSILSQFCNLSRHHRESLHVPSKRTTRLKFEVLHTPRKDSILHNTPRNCPILLITSVPRARHNILPARLALRPHPSSLRTILFSSSDPLPFPERIWITQGTRAHGSRCRISEAHFVWGYVVLHDFPLPARSWDYSFCVVTLRYATVCTALCSLRLESAIAMQSHSAWGQLRCHSL